MIRAVLLIAETGVWLAEDSGTTGHSAAVRFKLHFKRQVGRLAAQTSELAMR